MSKRTVYILGIIATLIFGSYLYTKHCCIDCHLQKSKFEPLKFKSNEQQIILTTIFKITGEGFNYSCETNFNFKKEDFNTIEPIDRNINAGIDKLKFFFDKNHDRRLIITGYTLNNEKNTSIYPNLGLARANTIKNYFIMRGISPNRIEISGKSIKKWHIEQNKISGPVHYSITNNQFSAAAQDWEAKKEKYNENPLYLYFNPNQSEIMLTDRERQCFADLITYLDNVPNATLECIGNSDNTYDQYTNIQLAQDRADFVKDYLISNGIAENRIIAISKGSEDPISDNITPEGKAKNRRTIIILK